MRTSNLLLLLLAVLIMVPSVEADYLLRVGAADIATNTIIDPATFTINGQTQVANPRATFASVPSGQYMQITGSASGYGTRIDDQFYDSSLPACVGRQTCDLSTTILDQTFVTRCGWSPAYQDFQCNVSNSGQWLTYFYKPDENRVTYIMLFSSVNPPQPNNPPVIAAAASPSSGNAPLSVAFTVNVTDDQGVQTVNIQFGDGQSQILPANSRPVHVYQNQGNYTVVITAFDNQGLSATRTLSIVVNPPGQNPPPSIAASVSPASGNAPLTSIFIANISDSDGVQNSTWYFGDGQSQSVGVNSQIAHTYSSAGAYLPYIESFDTLGSRATRSFSVQVNNPQVNTPPVIAAVVAPSNGTVPLTPAFTANVTDNSVVYRVTWFFGDGQSQVMLLAGSQPFSNTRTVHTYSAPGVYQAQVQAVDDLGLVSNQFFAVTVNSAVNSAPVVNANANPSSGLSPLAVNFSMDAFDDRGITGALWLFGDGQTFSVPVSGAPNLISHNIVHVYPAPGVYSAQIIVTDNNGAQTSRSLPINVTQSGPDIPPVIRAVVVPTFGLPPLTSTFTINVTDDRIVRTVTVFFGDSTSQNVVTNGNSPIANALLTHTYTAPGTYIAIIQAADDIGQVTTQAFNVLVTNPSQNTPPIVSASVSPTAGSAPLASTFIVNATDDQIISYAVWNFGDGQSQVLVQNGFLPALGSQIGHTYTSAGTYIAALTVIDNQGASTIRTFTVFVNTSQVGPPTIVASVSPLQGNAPLISAFTNNVTGNGAAINSVIWYFGDGQSQVVQPSAQINHTYTSVGTYFPLVLATDSNGLQSFRQFTVTVANASGQNQPPVISATVNPLNGTAPITPVFTANVSDDGSVVSVIWDFGDGATQPVGPNSQITHLYASPGVYTARITASDNLGAVSFRTFTLTVNALPGPNTPPVIAGDVNPTAGSAPLTPIFTANVTDNVQVSTVTWFFGDGQSQIVAQNGSLPYSNTRISHAYASPGTYSPMIVAIDNAGLTSTMVFIVTVMQGSGNASNAAPVIAASVVPAQGVAPLTPAFIANVTDDKRVASVVWDFGDGSTQTVLSGGLSTVSNTQTSHQYLVSGNYTARVTAVDNESASSFVQFTIAVSGSGGGNGTNGSNSTNSPPAIVANVSPLTGTAPLTSFFTANVTDNVAVSSVVWFFGDGSFTQVPANSRVNHTYLANGTYVAMIVATDNQGSSSTQQFVVTVASQGSGNGTNGTANSTIPQITITVSPSSGVAPITINFTAVVTDNIQVSSATWFFGDGTSAQVLWNGSSSVFVNSISHTYSNPGTYYATLVAFDNQGQAGVGLVTIVVQVNSSGQSYPAMVEPVYDVFIPQIRFDASGSGGAVLPGGFITAYVTFENRGATRLENIRASMIVPELGIHRDVGPLDVPAGNRVTKTILLDIPSFAQARLYIARMTVSNDDVHRVIHREFDVSPPFQPPSTPVPETLTITCPGPSVWCQFFN